MTYGLSLSDYNPLEQEASHSSPVFLIYLCLCLVTPSPPPPTHTHSHIHAHWCIHTHILYVLKHACLCTCILLVRLLYALQFACIIKTDMVKSLLCATPGRSYRGKGQEYVISLSGLVSVVVLAIFTAFKKKEVKNGVCFYWWGHFGWNNEWC